MTILLAGQRTEFLKWLKSLEKGEVPELVFVEKIHMEFQKPQTLFDKAHAFNPRPSYHAV